MLSAAKSEYSILRHICNGVLLNHDPRRTFVVAVNYSLYLDDGGHPADRPQVIASGFVSTEEKWLAFEPEWVSAVKEIGLGDVFHMAEFEQAFRGKPEKWGILNNLISIVMKHTIGTFISIVDMADYRRVNEEYPLEECIGKPYAIAARCVAAGINKWKAAEFKKDDRLLVFLEDGTLHRGDMEEVFKRDALPVPQPVPKATPAVQPADLLSWEVGNFYEKDTRRRTLRRIISESGVCIEGRYAKKQMLKALTQYNIPKRDTIAPNVQFVFHSSPKRVRARKIGSQRNAETKPLRKP